MILALFITVVGLGALFWLLLPEPEHDPTYDWWFADSSGPCWVCHEDTFWVYLDQAFQHRNCDAFPDENGEDIVIVRGERVAAFPWAHGGGI